MTRRAKEDRASGTERLRAVLHRLAETCRNPAHMIELFYWSAEPELIGILRRYVALPDEPKDALRAFLTMAADKPETVGVTVSLEGQVTLYSPTVTEIMGKTAHARIIRNRSKITH